MNNKEMNKLDSKLESTIYLTDSDVRKNRFVETTAIGFTIKYYGEFKPIKKQLYCYSKKLGYLLKQSCKDEVWYSRFDTKNEMMAYIGG